MSCGPLMVLQVLDDQECKRRFHISNGIAKAKINPYCAQLSINLNPGWNQVQLNIGEMTKKVYGTAFVECCKIRIHANCRLRRVYFSDRAYSEEELPDDYKLFALDIRLLPGLYGIGSERRADRKVQLDIDQGALAIEAN